MYRARDTKLDRDVAIKVLPAPVAQDPDRLARFEDRFRAKRAVARPPGVLVGQADFRLLQDLADSRDSGALYGWRRRR